MIAIIEPGIHRGVDADPEKFSARQSRGPLSCNTRNELMNSEEDSMDSIRATAPLLVRRVIAPTMAAK
jgi:hypothetical protein